MNRVYVVLVNWNSWADTIECLESLFQSDYDDYRVIVVDNGSIDGSVRYIRSWAAGNLNVFVDNALRSKSFPPCRKPIELTHYQCTPARFDALEDSDNSRLVLIQNSENLGFAGGNNIALRYAMSHGDFAYAWLLNNDTVVEKNSLSAMVSRMGRDLSIGMSGSKLLCYDKPEKIQALGGAYYCQWIGLPWHLGQLKKVSETINTDRVEKCMDYVVGASMLVSKKFLEKVGLMCEDYFLYFEEIDWALRGRDHFSLAYADDSVVYHKIGSSIGTSSNPTKKSLLCDFYSVRNRLLFTWRFFPLALPSVCIMLLGAICVRLLLGQWQRAKMIAKLIFTFRKLPMPYAEPR